MLETARSSLNTVGIFDRLLGLDTLAGRILRYGIASASGTIIDLTAFALLVAGGIDIGLAAACGYLLGTARHWQIFRHTRQKGLFVASGGLGVALTTCIVTLSVESGFDAAPSKIAAMCASFASVWLVRLLFVVAEDRLAP